MRVVRIILIVAGVLVLLAIAPLMLVFTLLAGWAFYIARVLPQVSVNPSAVATGLLCLLAVALIGHATARWLWREIRTGPPTPWRARWTLAGVMIVVLMFCCGIAATGIAHQTGWLIRSEESIFSAGRFDRMRCASNLRQIGQHMRQYIDEHGSLPDTLEQLLAEEPYGKDLLSCPAAPGQGYVYHGHALTLPLEPDMPIVCEPLANHRSGMTILFGDGRAAFVPGKEAEQVMSRLPR